MLGGQKGTRIPVVVVLALLLNSLLKPSPLQASLPLLPNDGTGFHASAPLRISGGVLEKRGHLFGTISFDQFEELSPAFPLTCHWPGLGYTLTPKPITGKRRGG